MAKPEISVLVPAYNASGTIDEALESLRRQTFGDWECVLVDDGSADSTADQIASWVYRDSRFVLVRGTHRGIVGALNRGLARCRGKFVARFDADDLMHRERLRLQRDALVENPELSGVGCHVRVFPRSTLTNGHKRYEDWLNTLCDEGAIFRDRFVESPLAHPTWMLRREVMLAHGYRDTDWPEDYDLLLRLLGAGCRLSTIPRRLLHWRDMATRLSRTGIAYRSECFTRCKAHFLSKSWLVGTETYVLWGYGDTGRLLARALLELGKRPSRIVERHPGRIGQRILGVPVIHASELAKLERAHGPIVVSVAGDQARSEVRGWATKCGLVENRDFVCAA